jgi:membrane protein DedA with SNARE-associated domain
VNWWDLIREAGDTFLLQHGVLAAFAYLALEEAGLPIPVPGDFLMLALGARAREGGIVLWQVIAAMEAGMVLGSSLLYVLARRACAALSNATDRLLVLAMRSSTELNDSSWVTARLPWWRVDCCPACGS